MQDGTESEFHSAAATADIAAIEKLIDADHAPNTKNAQGHYPLFTAIIPPVADQKNHTALARREAVFRKLAEVYPEALQGQDHEGNNLAHYLAAHGFVNLFQDYVIRSNSGLLLQANNRGEFPIHPAIVNRRQKIFESILDSDKKDDIVQQNTWETKNIFHYLARHGTQTMLTFFLQKLPKTQTRRLLNQNDATSVKPIDYLQYNTFDDTVELRKLMVANGATVSDFGDRGTPSPMRYS